MIYMGWGVSWTPYLNQKDIKDVSVAVRAL